MKLKVKCPAKINLKLKVFKKDEITGYHPIESVMQSVSLCDYLTVETNKSGKMSLEGSSSEIAYDNNNLIIKAANAFFEKANIKCEGLNIYIEKNIPVAAGLAGGSTDAAGIILALNKIYEGAVSDVDIYNINSSLGSDINFCYMGGKALCKGKGDDITPLPYEKFELLIVKPKKLKISTKDAYSAFDNLNEDSNIDNDLEFAMLPHYEELRYLHSLGFKMSGSGPSFFMQKSKLEHDLNLEIYQIFENLISLDRGVTLV